MNLLSRRKRSSDRADHPGQLPPALPLPLKPVLAALPDVPPSAAVGYGERQERALAVEGMMSAFSMQVMDAVLAYQASINLRGPLFETGVWKGRSASIISAHVREGELLILSDIQQLLSEQVLATAIYVRPVFVLGASKGFRDSFNVGEIRGRVRFAHVDSSHSYRDTLAEMELVDEILAPGGVACLDDFTNLNYSQILPAVFKYLYTTQTDLGFFLVTSEKGYLCRKPFADSYGSFVLHQLLDEMHDRGNDEVMLSRTDADAEYRAFYLRRRDPGETGRFYGTELYSEFYKAP